jgi:hypothetical protein
MPGRPTTPGTIATACRTNAAAIIVVGLLIWCGYWLFDTLAEMRDRTASCPVAPVRTHRAFRQRSLNCREPEGSLRFRSGHSCELRVQKKRRYGSLAVPRMNARGQGMNRIAQSSRCAAQRPRSST